MFFTKYAEKYHLCAPIFAPISILPFFTPSRFFNVQCAHYFYSKLLNGFPPSIFPFLRNIYLKLCFILSIPEINNKEFVNYHKKSLSKVAESKLYQGILHTLFRYSYTFPSHAFLFFETSL